jgi:hypothetical protein
MATGVYVFIVLAALVIRFIIKIAKEKPSTPPYRPNQQQYNTPSMKQPPPFVPPSQQTSTDFSNLFEEQKSSYKQPTSSTPPSFDVDEVFSSFSNLMDKQKNSPPPYNNEQDSFSNMPSRNTNSNMGAGSQSYYCMYCGKKFQTTAALKMDTCFKHPKSDQGLQKHVMYMGAGRPNIGF